MRPIIRIWLSVLCSVFPACFPLCLQPPVVTGPLQIAAAWTSKFLVASSELEKSLWVKICNEFKPASSAGGGIGFEECGRTIMQWSFDRSRCLSGTVTTLRRRRKTNTSNSLVLKCKLQGNGHSWVGASRANCGAWEEVAGAWGKEELQVMWCAYCKRFSCINQTKLDKEELQVMWCACCKRFSCINQAKLELELELGKTWPELEARRNCRQLIIHKTLLFHPNFSTSSESAQVLSSCPVQVHHHPQCLRRWVGGRLPIHVWGEEEGKN